MMFKVYNFSNSFSASGSLLTNLSYRNDYEKKNYCGTIYDSGNINIVTCLVVRNVLHEVRRSKREHKITRNISRK